MRGYKTFLNSLVFISFFSNQTFSCWQSGCFTVEDFATAINEATPKTAKRDAVSGEKHSITLTSLFSQAREEVLDLDDLVKGLIDDEQHDFIDGYFGVRNINNRGEKTKKDVRQPPVPNP